MNILQNGFLLEIARKVCERNAIVPRLMGHSSSIIAWINREDGPSKYCQSSTMHMMDYVPNVHTGGCLLGDTLITMEMQILSLVENLSENDVIVGESRELGLVSHHRIEYTVNQHTLVYGKNEDTPFFTADHPFWTQDGWRAIDPVTAKEENTWLKVGQLVVSDRVRTTIRPVKSNMNGLKLIHFLKHQ